MILKLLKLFLPKTMEQHELSSWYLGWMEGYQEGLLDQLRDEIMQNHPHVARPVARIN